MSIAAAEARVRAQQALLNDLALVGRDTTEAERTLAALRRMLEIERAERRMWTGLVQAFRRRASPAAPA